MGLFSKNKQLSSAEYQDVLGKIAQLVNEISMLKGDMSRLTTDQNSLRGLINRKMGRSDLGDSGDEMIPRREVESLLKSMGIVT